MDGGLVKIWNDKNARSILNLIICLAATCYLALLTYDVVTSFTLHENVILSIEFVKKVWGSLLKFILLIIALYYCSNTKWYSNYPVQKFTGSHLFAQLLTVSAILAGAYVSIMSTDINSAIQCHLTETQCADNLPNFAAISVVIILIVLFYILHGTHSVKLKNEREKHENDQSEKLRLAIQIAPPPYFAKKLADYSDIVEDMFQEMSDRYTSLLDESLPPKPIQEGEKILEEQRVIIRCSLMALGRLAQAYDNVDPSEKTAVKYRANLMLCLKSDDDICSHFEETHTTEALRFAIPFGAKPYFKLYIDDRYSINVEQKEDKLNNADLFEIDREGHIKPLVFEADETVENAIMPVYWEENKDVTNYNVIGAPKSIVKGDEQFISNTVKEARAASYYSEDIQNLVIDYFKNDTKGRSIVSLPVATRHYKLSQEHKEDIDRFLGVINIYRNTEDIFAGEKKNFEFFADFTRPLRLVIARMAYTHFDSIAIVEERKADKSSTND